MQVIRSNINTDPLPPCIPQEIKSVLDRKVTIHFRLGGTTSATVKLSNTIKETLKSVSDPFVIHMIKSERMRLVRPKSPYFQNILALPPTTKLYELKDFETLDGSTFEGIRVYESYYAIKAYNSITKRIEPIAYEWHTERLEEWCAEQDECHRQERLDSKYAMMLQLEEYNRE